MPAIEVTNLIKKYGETTAIDGINFEIQRGEIIGFLGPNGAGKTTTMKILTCFLEATSGEARICGHDCYEEPLEVRRKIGYLPENCPLYSEMNVHEYLEYASSMHGIEYKESKKRIRATLNSCGLEDKIFTDIGELSKGYKQRVGLAAALMHDPEILILDEPTTGLDPNQRIEIRNLIKNIGSKKTVILSSHILPEVEATCSRVIIINKGRIAASGRPEELQARSQSKVCVNVVIEGEESDAKMILEKIKGITEIEAKGKVSDSEFAFEVFSLPDSDLRKPLIDIFSRSKSTNLLEIYRREVTLEDVFTELTKE